MRIGKATTEGIKGFLLLHAEKPIFWGLCSVLGLLVYRGAMRENLGDDRSPAALGHLAKTVERSIAESEWDPQRLEVTSTDFVGKARRSLVAVDPLAYRMRTRWSDLIRQVRRKDPQIFPPVELEGIPGYGVFALVNPDYQQLLKERGKTESGGPDLEIDPVSGAAISSDPRHRYRNRNGSYGSSAAYRGIGSDLGATVAGDVRMTAPTGSKVAARHFVSLVALVPLMRQNQEYVRALGAASGYDPAVDFPDYRMYAVERVEEIYNSPGVPIEWSERNPSYRHFLVGSKTIAREARQWNCESSELVDAQFVQPGLVFPLGPILQKSWKRWATHPKIPLAGPATLESSPTEPPRQDNPTELVDLLEAASTADAFGGSYGSNAVNGRSPGDRSGFAHAGRGYNPNARFGSYGRSGYGIEPMVVEYVLFRHFDFSVEPGQRYRYRVRLVAMDPNHGRSPSQLLTPRRFPDKTYYALSPYSEPSPVVAIPPPGNLLAGEVTIRRGEPRAKLMALGLAPSQMAEAAKEFWVTRGDVANFRQSVTVMNPLQHDMSSAPAKEDRTTTTVRNHSFRTDLLVVDIRGGRKLTSSKGRDSELTEPGALLLFGPQGRLFVRRELDDFAEYQDSLARIEGLEAIPEIELDADRSPIRSRGRSSTRGG